MPQAFCLLCNIWGVGEGVESPFLQGFATVVAIRERLRQLQAVIYSPDREGSIIRPNEAWSRFEFLNCRSTAKAFAVTSDAGATYFTEPRDSFA